MTQQNRKDKKSYGSTSVTIGLRFKTATKGRQQEQHLGRRGSVVGGAVIWAVGSRAAGRTLATAGRSNSFSRLDECHHFIATAKRNDDTQLFRLK